MRSRSTIRAAQMALLLLCAAFILCLPRTAPAASPEAITAIGDIHGDFDDLLSLLQHCGLTDAQQHWIGGKTTLVQTGDVLDRGPKVREALDLLMSLQKQAPKKGGRVVVLLGNHEVMNIMGDLRYVTAENYASFAGKNADKLEQSAYREYTSWRHDHAALLAGIPQAFPDSTQAEWMARHPAGFIEQRQAFSPEGKYGKWLRQQPAVVEVEHIVFLHGGIDPSLASMKLEDMDRRVHEEISAFDRAKEFLVAQHLVLPFFTLQEITAVVQAEVRARENAPASRHPAVDQAGQLPEHTQLELMKNFLDYGQWLSVASNGPLWFRGYDEWSDPQLAAQIPAVLSAYGAVAIVVAHTPQRDHSIRSRLGGKLFLIDTGMLSPYFHGRASALQVRNGVDFTAEYMDQSVALSGSGRP